MADRGRKGRSSGGRRTAEGAGRGRSGRSRGDVPARGRSKGAGKRAAHASAPPRLTAIALVTSAEDASAVAQAVALGETIALVIGPESAAGLARGALALGAARAYRL